MKKESLEAYERPEAEEMKLVMESTFLLSGMNEEIEDQCPTDEKPWTTP